MIVLGIETSCDETAVALIKDDKSILSHHVFSQLNEHKEHGGVVPEIAARSHLQYLTLLIKKTLNESDLTLDEIDGIAVTCGPGLIGGLIVGVMVAKTLVAIKKKPFLAINHLVGHALTPRLTHNLAFPYLLLLVSGGHCQLVIVHSVENYTVLGSTLDDAVGECFDKCAQLLELPYPGGPSIEAAALHGNPGRFYFPRPLKRCKDKSLIHSFSFSGLKSAVRREIEKIKILDKQTKSDICASLQMAIADTLKDRLKNALCHSQNINQNLNAVVIAGGVAANKFLRDNLQEVVKDFTMSFIAPPLDLCTDNGAMIAWAGIEKLREGLVDSLDFKPRPRWPLDIKES